MHACGMYLHAGPALLPFGVSPQEAKAAQKQQQQRTDAAQRSQPGASSSSSSDPDTGKLLKAILLLHGLATALVLIAPTPYLA